MVAAELQATAVDLQGHSGGMRDQIIQQQLQTIQTTLGNVQGVGSDSLLTGLMLERRAAALGVGPTDDEVQAEIDRRRLNAARLQLSLILAIPEMDKDAKPGPSPPTSNGPMPRPRSTRSRTSSTPAATSQRWPSSAATIRPRG